MLVHLHEADDNHVRIFIVPATTFAPFWLAVTEVIAQLSFASFFKAFYMKSLKINFIYLQIQLILI